ncbi:carbohydrate ABC transporter permease [Kaistia geumhonensis]|uniref:Maltose/maltodextrin transport system permease protein MalG n=1 Tax=Kaistia geumhonensis TaxID=410839 RepID=A0ABU0M4G9_9HYPH|nr:carbohydrate ABC transporter permease [Kaistia geumhonensis]MCX5478922.1 carbohydrate ABC transporter permease [Kaistia geumhonensis]MDQ0515859.1 multiple sugar transport system permease protein [Kaistia geumhonensis]
MTSESREKLWDLATYLIAIIIAAFFLVPLLWLLSLALRTRQEVFLGASRFIPKRPTLGNFEQILSDPAFINYLWNGLKLSALGGIGCLIVAAPAAYAFSRFHFQSRSSLMMSILAFQMVSPLVILVPLYRYMASLGLLDGHFGVTMIYIAVSLPMAVWLLKSSIDGIPKSLEEAAQIDGCSRFGIFWRITLPLVAPGLASAFILIMILNWSQFLVPFLLLTTDSKLPISVAIFTFAGTSSASSTQVLAAACLVAVVPAIVAFLLLQRMIVGALTAGAVKG